MRDIMQCTDSDTHDDSLQSSPSIENCVSSVMPAATVHSQSFIESPFQDVALMANESFRNEPVTTQNPVHAQHVLKLLHLQRQAGFLCDITIHVKDRSFKAHKPLLAACSLYFRTLFANPESKESTALDLVSLTPVGFEILLDYIYSGHLAITADNCSAVLSAAICLRMTNVEETCKKFMQSSFQLNSNKDLPLPDYFADKNSFRNVSLLKSGKNALHSIESAAALSGHLRNEHAIPRSGNDKTGRLLMKSADAELKLSPNANLPSASELQSVLPILMTSIPRQPTPTEVQSILASFPNATELFSRYPMLYSAKTLADQLQKYQSAASENSKQGGNHTTPVSMHLAVTSSAFSSQNGNHSLPKETGLSDVGSAQDSSTRCSAAPFLTTTEQGRKWKDEGHWKHKTSLHSTALERNSIEISSDEEDKRQIAPKTPVSKALSLPSLSENPIIVPVARARSAENENKTFYDGLISQRSLIDQYVGRKSLYGDELSETDERKEEGGARRYSGTASDTLSPTTEQYVESSSSHASIDEPVTRNYALDLSTQSVGPNGTFKPVSQGGIQHIALTRRSDSEMGFKNSSRRSSDASSFSDPGMQLAADALSMLKQSKSKESGFLSDYQGNSALGDSISNEPQDNSHESSGWDEESGPSTASGSSKQATFSRKPRRTTGGQTCSWPGCKRLFRHRNIYEEHQRMHEKGIPASQLRKCYMGARVKKTVREQLEEMRTSDSVFDAANEPEGTKFNRARKRKSNSESQEPARKRVNVKDRVGNVQFSSSPTTFSVAKETSSSTMRPPTLIPAFSSKVFPVVGPDGIVKLVHSGESAVNSTQQSGLSFASSPYSMATGVKSSIAGSLGLNRAAMQGMNPVAATLALLGMQSPLRQTEADATSPLEQYRQRLSGDMAAQLSPGMASAQQQSAALLTDRSPEPLARGLSYQGDMGSIKETLVMNRSRSTSSSSPNSNTNHPN